MSTFRERDYSNIPGGVASQYIRAIWAEKRREREELFNLELPYLFNDTPTTVIMGVTLIASSHKQASRAASISTVP
jgi:hypothetical protein